MTELEVYLHGVIESIKEIVMTDGLAAEEDFLIANLCDTAHRIYRQKMLEQMDKAPSGPGGLKHNE